MDDFIREFNKFFAGKALVTVSDKTLEITIGPQTLIISLPDIVGCQSTRLS
jgi:hypothetical protein